MKKVLLLIVLIINITTLYSQEKRLFELISPNEDESFIALEAGNYIGLSLISKRMVLNTGYSYLLNRGFNISTELLLFNYSFSDNFSFNCGLGGSIIFTPGYNFKSDLLLSLSTKVRYRDFFIKFTPMYGTTMFQKRITWKSALFVGVGYQFDLFKLKRDDTELEEDTKVDSLEESDVESDEDVELIDSSDELEKEN